MDKCEAVLRQIATLSSNDADLASRQFFSLLNYIASVDGDLTKEIIKRIVSNRPQIADEHLAWLLFASTQCVTEYAFDCLQLELEAEKIEELRCFLASVLREKCERIVELCSINNLCTNIPNRYAGLQIIANLAFRGNPIRVLDIGCSFGLGLMALNRTFFKNIDVVDNLLKRAIQPGLELDLWGLDMFQPDLEWLCACFLPEYREHRAMAKMIHREATAKGEAFHFIRGDALDMSATSALTPGSYDIVWTSNICFEVEGNSSDFLEAIKDLLKPTGFWVSAYYRNSQL